MTGEEIVNEINERYTDIFSRAKDFIKCDPEAMKPFEAGYYDPVTQLNPKIDYAKFIRHMDKAWKNGESIFTRFGLDGLRKVARALQISMIARHDPKRAEKLAEKPFEKTGELPVEMYWPHMMFNTTKAKEALTAAALQVKNDPRLSEKARRQELTKLVFKHRNLAGDYNWTDIAEWQMTDQVLSDIAAKKKTSKKK